MLNQDALLAQVRRMNAKSEAARASREASLLDRAHALRDELALAQETLVRLRHEKDSADYAAARAARSALEAELSQVASDLDPASEFAGVRARVDALAQASAEAARREEAGYAARARRTDDRLHKKTGWAAHPRPFDGRTMHVKDVISRPLASMGEADPSLLRQEWTRFDHRPSVPWRPSKPGDGLAAIAAAERRAAQEAESDATYYAEKEARKPALDLSFGLAEEEGKGQGQGDGEGEVQRAGGGASGGRRRTTGRGAGRGAGRASSSVGATARSGHRGVAGGAHTTRSAAARTPPPSGGGPGGWRATGGGVEGGGLDDGEGDLFNPAAAATTTTTRPTALPSVPSATVTARQLTQRAVPSALLDTMSPEQLRKPRHPAYLLDSTVHHPARWLKTDKTDKYPKPFSVPPRMKGLTQAEERTARRAIVPDRNFYRPRNEGKEEFLQTDEAPYPLFSHVPLDSEWLKVHEGRKRAELEARFYRAAEEGAGEGFEGEDAFEGGGGGGGGAAKGAGAGAAAAAEASAAAAGLALTGAPSLGYLSAQRYAARKAEVASALRPPHMGTKILAEARAKEAAKMEALAARIIGSVRSGAGGSSTWAGPGM